MCRNRLSVLRQYRVPTVLTIMSTKIFRAMQHWTHSNEPLLWNVLISFELAAVGPSCLRDHGQFCSLWRYFAIGTVLRPVSSLTRPIATLLCTCWLLFEADIAEPSKSIPFIFLNEYAFGRLVILKMKTLQYAALSSVSNSSRLVISSYSA